MQKHFALGKVNDSLVFVVIDTEANVVKFKTRGRRIVFEDIFGNDNIFSELINCCYGLGDGSECHIGLHDHIEYYHTIEIPIIANLIQEHYDQILKEEGWS